MKAEIQVVDHVKPIMSLIASGNIENLQDEAERLFIGITRDINEFQKAIAELSEQANLIRSLMKRYSPLDRKPDEKEREPVALQEAGTEPADDGLTSSNRSKLIKEVALGLAFRGIKNISVNMILVELERRGIKFSIKRPGSAVGTVVATMPLFEKVGLGQYVFVGNKEKKEEEN